MDQGRVFLLCLGPLAFWSGALSTRSLRQSDRVHHPATGDWTLRFLLITLAVTPLRKILRLPDLIRFRRMLGLFAFFYACCTSPPTSGWTSFSTADMWKDVEAALHHGGLHRFVLMIPLAMTSTAGWIRRLGGRRWQSFIV